jgi:internalin A
MSKRLSVADHIEAARIHQSPLLDLSDQGLTELPDSIGQLTALEELNLNDNQLTALPDSIGQMTELQRLHLNGNKLASLPDSIGQLSRLRNLYITYNRLTELPKSIGKLTRLQTLSLSYNHLAKLPESIGQLAKLKGLYLDENRLTGLPRSIGKLAELEELDLSGNRLATLPDSLHNLKNLTHLYLHRNHVLSLPLHILGPTYEEVFYERAQPARSKDILDYYFRVRGGRRPLNEAKLILVGRGAVGKTSIVNRLVDGVFREVKKTEGINITEWPLLLNRTENVRLNIWDFGGQEIMHATHQFFLTQRSLYLLVLNGREGFEDTDAEYWLKLIEGFGGASPVIVVLNKIEEHPFDLNRRALQQKYPFIRDFVRTDCKSGTGIAQLHRAIERETDRLEHLRDALPACWFNIKEGLARMEKSYLSFEEYRKFCSKKGERDRAAQEKLADYLHDLGIMLNYRDDPRLQDTHVLNPRWVTNGIYQLLNSPKLEKQKGEIRLQELPEILDTKEYPPPMSSFIIDLMKKFELCFSFPEDDTHYLITELLDKQEPVEVAALAQDESLNFQYHYTVLMEGLLPRFIVRTQVLSEGLPRWRTGVILEFEGNRALVKADAQDKKVFISVYGPVSGRRSLLAVIRSDFERIHHDIRNLQPQEMIPVPGHPDVLVPYDTLLLWESSNRLVYSASAAGKILDLNVHDLLNGVDLEGTRRREKTTDERKTGLQLFYSYSHEDESLRNKLEIHLKILQRRGLIETWNDRKIEAGDDWRLQIDKNLENADIILLLVSANFFASDYAYEKEMGRALERQRNGEARVIPIIVRDANLNGAPFAGLQYLPSNGQAVSEWKSKDSAWRDVSEGIERVVLEMRRKTARSAQG